MWQLRIDIEPLKQHFGDTKPASLVRCQNCIENVSPPMISAISTKPIKNVHNHIRWKVHFKGRYENSSVRGIEPFAADANIEQMFEDDLVMVAL